MPLAGYTDQVRIKRLGKIRLGERVASQGGREHPKAWDHFNFVDARAVESVYGQGQPCRSIAPVFLPFNPEGRARDPISGRESWNFDNCWLTSRSAYKSAGLFCRCDQRAAIPNEDGELVYAARRANKGVAERDLRNKKKGEPIDRQGWDYLKAAGLEVEVGDMFEMPCPGNDCPYWQHSFCKPIGTLDLYLPNVPGRGIWTLQTSGFHSIRNIESALQQLGEDMSGMVTGVPLVLNLKPQDAQVGGRKKVIFVLELICPLNIQQLAGLKRKALDTGSFSVIDALPAASEPIPDDLVPHAGRSLDSELGEPTEGEVVMCDECHTAHAPDDPCPDVKAAFEGEDGGGDGEGNEYPNSAEDIFTPTDDEPPHPADQSGVAEAAAKGQERAEREAAEPKPEPKPKRPVRGKRGKAAPAAKSGKKSAVGLF